MVLVRYLLLAYCSWEGYWERSRRIIGGYGVLAYAIWLPIMGGFTLVWVTVVGYWTDG